MSARYRVGIDVGGTFTDFVLADMAPTSSGGGLRFHKEPSVPADPSLAVERGIAAMVAQFGIAASEIELVVHGTTIGLNAIIQRRGARLAMVVSRGNRDVLEIARLRMPSSYDVNAPREAPLVRRTEMFEIDARMRSDGSIDTEPSAEALAALGAQLAAAKVDAVAVMLLNSYRDAALEHRVAAALRPHLGSVPVTCSADLWPEVREYERALVAGLNAYIAPMMDAYFTRLSARAAALGVVGPIYITANNGGTLSLETARARPIDTVLSGPASGVVASCRVGGAAGQDKLITLDMGGTSADISIVGAGTPEFTTATFVGDFPLMMPVVNVAAIGAGGGSVLWVDDQGVLKVGPRSAGADPGPVAYGRGGTEPTVTDAYLALGILDPTKFLGGRMTLDGAAASAALTALGARIGLDGPATAEAALRVASAKMAAELIKLLATAGADPRDHALVAFGGAGPTHATLLAEEAGLNRVLVPTAPGNFCALGATLADVRRDYVRTARHLVGAGAPGWPAIAAALSELTAQARAWVADEGALIGAHDLAIILRARYPEQAYELDVAVPAEGLDGDVAAQKFHEAHQRLYGFSEAASPVQITTVRLSVIGRVPPVALPDAAATTPVPTGMRAVRHRGGTVAATVFSRATLGAGARLQGPAIIEQQDTTTWLAPGWTATVDRIGTLHLERVA